MALLRDHLHFSLSLTINVHNLVFKCSTCFLRHFLSSSNHNHYTELLRVGFTYCLPKYFGPIGFPDFLFLVAMLKWPVQPNDFGLKKSMTAASPLRHYLWKTNEGSRWPRKMPSCKILALSSSSFVQMTKACLILNGLFLLSYLNSSVKKTWLSG